AICRVIRYGGMSCPATRHSSGSSAGCFLTSRSADSTPAPARRSCRLQKGVKGDGPLEHVPRAAGGRAARRRPRPGDYAVPRPEGLRRPGDRAWPGGGSPRPPASPRVGSGKRGPARDDRQEGAPDPRDGIAARRAHPLSHPACGRGRGPSRRARCRPTARCRRAARRRGGSALMASFAARPPRATRVPRASRAARASRTHGNPLLKPRLPEWRSRFVVAMVALGFLGLIARAGYLQLFSHDYLQRQGELRYGRTLELPASRGSIYDRNRVLLAASRPVRGIFAVPRNLQASPAQLEDLARLLGMSQAALGERLADRDRQFVYLKRGVEIDVAEQVMALRIRGVSTLAEYTREYPIGERGAHLIGFTGFSGNAEGEQLQGRAGVERMFDELLTGRPGSRRVIQDARGNFVEAVGDEQAPIDGADVVLSIDNELQFHAYHAIREAAIANKAKAAAAVVVDVHTGEILALANWPSADPNQRDSLDV